MSEAMSPQSGLTRRSFLKTTAAVAGTAALATGCGFSSIEAQATDGVDNAEQVFVGICRPNCPGQCPMNVHVRNGKIVKTSKLDLPIPENERICQRGRTHVERVYNPKRIMYPLRRVGERGSGQWERITWEEAIGEICTKWKGYVTEYGPQSIAVIGNSGNLAADTSSYPRAIFAAMGTTAISNRYDQVAKFAFENTFATNWSNGVYLNDARNMQNAKYIFVWSCNETVSEVSTHAQLQAALDKGAKLIVIDPTYTTIASKADMFVSIRPGTDAVLAMAMMNIVIAEGKSDLDTLMYSTVAPFLVKKEDGKYLRLSDLGQAVAGDEEDKIVVRSGDGTIGLPDDIENPVISGSYSIEGHDVTTSYDLLLEKVAEWTPERASELCDIPVDTIYELAHMYAEGPSVIHIGWGVDRYSTARYMYYATTALSMVAGQIGKPGTGFSGYVAVRPSSCCLAGPKISCPEGVDKGPSFAAPLLYDAVTKGKYGYTDTDVNIKSIFCHSADHVGNQTNRQETLAVFDSAEFIVAVDLIYTDTVGYADIVLPAAHFFEVETAYESTAGVVVCNEKAIDPVGEAKPDLEIANLIAEGMGYGSLTIPREKFLTGLFENEKAEAAGITWEILKEKKVIPFLLPDEPATYIGMNNKYGTPTGRAQFYFEDIKVAHDYGQSWDKRHEMLPYDWEPPYEGWTDSVGSFEKNTQAEKYPLNFLQFRNKFTVHKSFAYQPSLLELQPEPTVALSPKDAKARGIGNGDIVKIYNDRGYLVVKATINPGTRNGTVVISHGWEGDQFIEGHYQDLTSNRIGCIAVNNSFFDCLVEVEKM